MGDQVGDSREVQCDADGQHDPSTISSLIATQENHGAHLVIGNRFAVDHDYEVNGLPRMARRDCRLIEPSLHVCVLFPMRHLGSGALAMIH